VQSPLAEPNALVFKPIMDAEAHIGPSDVCLPLVAMLVGEFEEAWRP